MKLALVLFTALSLLACKGDPGPTTVLSGDITGKVYVFDPSQRLVNDRSGVQVSLDQGSLKTATVYDGSWKLSGVPAGIHTLLFVKTGYFTVKQFNLQFVGGGTFYSGDIGLQTIPGVTVAHLYSTQPDSNDVVYFSGTLNAPDSIFHWVSVIIDTLPISSSPTISYLFYLEGCVAPDSTNFSFGNKFDDYLRSDYHLKHNTTVYARAYALPVAGFSDNYNPSTGKAEIYDSEVSLSNMVTFIIP